VPLATPLLDLAAAALDPASDPVVGGSAKKKRKSGVGGAAAVDAAAMVAEMDTWRMRTNALAALRRLFVHDGGDFLDAGRFNQLHPLVTRQLVATPPTFGVSSSDVLPEAEEGAHLADGGLGAEVVACVAALVAAAPDDALWKPAHRGVLLATRDSAPRARLIAVAALSAVVDRLQEEYLALLPEVGAVQTSNLELDPALESA
jgi:U3 small nucleolar RNA-associated protein 10